jgi:hypothetical protein
LTLRIGRLRKHERWKNVLLALRVDLLAYGNAGNQHFALERLVGVGRGVVVLEPVLDVLVVVRVAVGR